MTEFLANELTRLNKDASSFTAENSEDIVHQSPDNPTTWTNEKHNLYLDHLEVSFVKQLQQSMGLLACFEQNKSEKHLSQKRHADVHISSHQDGCCQKINYGRGQPFLHSSADTHDALKSPRVQRFGRTCLPASAAWQECLVLCSTEKHVAVEGIGCQGLKTCPHQLQASNLYTGDISDFMIESVDEETVETQIYIKKSSCFICLLDVANLQNMNSLKRLSHSLSTVFQTVIISLEFTGQNFVDGDCQNNSNKESRAKRLKTALANNSNHDQIVPSWNCPTTDYSVIDGGET